MSRRCLILVEGPTEERFVKAVLAPHLIQLDLTIVPTILLTKIVKNGPNFKGGVSSFGKFQSDMRRLLHGAGGALVTTMLDYYGLPGDFPGMSDRPSGTPVARVSHVERAIREAFGSPPSFLPFLVLHEFEAWLFASPDELPKVMTEPRKQPMFASVCGKLDTPEAINERPESAPSKRIAALFPGYRKTLHGPLTAQRIGLQRIRSSCPHFDEWLAKLEAYARATLDR